MREFKWSDGKTHYGKPDPYHDPEECGVEIVFMLHEDLNYEFNIVLIVRDIKTGKIFIDCDFGCSCPSPFENTHGLDDMTEIGTIEEAISFANTGYHKWPLKEIDAMREAIAKAISTPVGEARCE